jgi:roadblock/LC7 domain-containing protein
MAYTSNQATVSNTAQDLEDIGFSVAEIVAANEMVITVTGAALRYRFGGTATAANGHIIGNGDTFVFVNESFGAFSCIRQADTDCDVFITLKS